MAYMNKNINILLLALIVLIASSLVGATVYYQNNFQGLNDEYDSKLEQLNNVSADLAKQRAELNLTAGKLKLTTSREEELSKKFTNLSSVKDDLAKAKTDLENDNEDLEDRIIRLKKDIKDVRGTLEIAEDKNEELLKEVDTLKTENEEFEEEIEDLEDDVDDLDDLSDCLASTDDAAEGDC